MENNRKPVGPISVIEDLFNNELNTLLDELMKKITLKDYTHPVGTTWILVNIRNNNYNPVVLNEVKRRYLNEGWGNIFYNVIDNNIITFQFYFPQTKSVII